MALTNYAATRILAALLGESSYTIPTDVHLALFTTATDADGGGTEVTGGGYARQLVVFDAVVAGVSRNTDDVVFTDLPAATVTHAAIYDAPTGGNMLMHGALQPAKTLIAGATLRLTAASISATLE